MKHNEIFRYSGGMCLYHISLNSSKFIAKGVANSMKEALFILNHVRKLGLKTIIVSFPFPPCSKHSLDF